MLGFWCWRLLSICWSTFHVLCAMVPHPCGQPAVRPRSLRDLPGGPWASQWPRVAVGTRVARVGRAPCGAVAKMPKSWRSSWTPTLSSSNLMSYEGFFRNEKGSSSVYSFFLYFSLEFCKEFIRFVLHGPAWL